MSRKNNDFATATTGVKPAAICMASIPAHGVAPTDHLGVDRLGDLPQHIVADIEVIPSDAISHRSGNFSHPLVGLNDERHGRVCKIGLGIEGLRRHESEQPFMLECLHAAYAEQDQSMDVAKIAIGRLRGDTCLICDRFHRQVVEPSLPLDDGFASGQQPLHGLHRSGLTRHHAKSAGDERANRSGREIA